MPRIVLIDGRFELLNGPEKIDVFDIRNLRRDKDDHVNPILVIPMNPRRSDKDAGKIALEKLRDSKYITMSEYLSFLDIFLASVRPDGSAFRNEPEQET